MTPKPPLDLSKLDVPETGGGSFIEPQKYDTRKVIYQIKGMLVGDDYEYAEDTLRGILTTIERTGEVTDGQVRAIDHIAEKPHNRAMETSRGGFRRELRRRRERE